MASLQWQKVIFVGAHPDDIELGCGGTIRRFATSATRYEILCIYLTQGGFGGATGATRRAESCRSCRVLGVKKRNVHFATFPDTKFQGNIDAILFLEQFYLRRTRHGDKQPKGNIYAVFIHSRNDVHQDHRQAFSCCRTAFRHAPRIFAYESPSSDENFKPTTFVSITQAQMGWKRKALNEHKSQLKLKRWYLEKEAILNLSRFRGRQGGVAFAEAFETIKNELVT
jgi:LmbE family N-acetylglucosaminyl deacetylase